MKKVILVLIGLLCMAGCGSGDTTEADHGKTADTTTEEKVKVLTADEAGKALIDGMIFQKNQELVREHFEGAEDLLDDPESGDTADLAALLVTGMQIEAPDLTDADAAIIANNLKNEMDSKVSYEISEIVDNGDDTYDVTYSIKGVNYMLALEKGTRQTLDKITADPTLATNESAIQTMIFQGFGESLVGVGVIEVPVETTVTLTKDDKKWLVQSSETDAVQQLLYCCMLGVTSESQLEAQALEMSERVMSEYL